LSFHLVKCYHHGRAWNGALDLRATTVGFPYGSHATGIKVAEAKEALDDGAEELDMVVNVGKVLSGDWEYVRSDIKAVVDLAHERGKIIKVY